MTITNGIQPATMNALNKSSYIVSSNYSSSYLPEIFVGLAILFVICIGLYFLNKKIHFMKYVREFFQDQCAYCNKDIAKKEGVRKTINYEGTMIRRKMVFCNENHLNEYLKKWGEPLGCGCSMKFEKFSFEWWIQWSKIFVFIGFLLFIILIIILER